MDIVLAKHLEPWDRYFGREDVTDIVVNRPGQIGLDACDGWEWVNDSNMTTQYLRRFLSQLANVQDQLFSDLNPMLATTIPWETKIKGKARVKDFRIHAIWPGVARYRTGKEGIIPSFSLSIRVAKTRKLTVRDLSFKKPKGRVRDVADKIPDISGFPEKKLITALESAVADGRTILVVGGTSSGKTTVLNALAEHIPPQKRVITYEDSQELVVTQKNHVNLVSSKTGTGVGKFNHTDVINSITRMRPDRVVLGELDIGSTMPFLRIINTGHAGCMTTLHANSPELAIEALIQNARFEGVEGADSVLRAYIAKAIDIIVFCHHDNDTNNYWVTVHSVDQVVRQSAKSDAQEDE